MVEELPEEYSLLQFKFYITNKDNNCTEELNLDLNFICDKINILIGK